MSLHYGRRILSIPGPSVIPESVLNAMHRPSPNIYAGELHDITESLFPDLKAVARTNGDAAIYIANGHGAWEATLKNTLRPGDKALVLSTGRFAFNWGVMAETHGIEVDVLEFGMQGDADPNRLEEALRADTEGSIKAVLTVQADTASSVLNDIPKLREAIDNARHDALFMVDCIASLACDHYEMDAWGADVTVAACQKGLMTPAGIAFVYFNEKAKAARALASPGGYWDWVPRTEGEIFYQKFGGTAPTHHLYGLCEALDMLVHEEGIENAWARHRTISKAVWSAIDVWGQGGSFQHNIGDTDKRTAAVSAIVTGDGDATRLRRWCEKEAGLTLGIGLGFGEPGSADWDRHFRIGHMGYQNVPMVMGILGTIDCGLKALGIVHGGGALPEAAEVLSLHTK